MEDVEDLNSRDDEVGEDDVPLIASKCSGKCCEVGNLVDDGRIPAPAQRALKQRGIVTGVFDKQDAEDLPDRDHSLAKIRRRALSIYIYPRLKAIA